MSDMIEQVALAMVKSDGDYTVMDHWRRRAQAAIEAMRQPTETMVRAGFIFSEHGTDPEQVWAGMIDAALENKPV